MPFDGSGNFSRVHDWTDDRDAGIKIRADRMDQEFDDMASAFNAVFFRNGLVPMTGDLDMGSNDVKGVATGTAIAPSIQFASDPNTGIYLNGAGKIGFAANGIQRFEIDTAGAEVFGTFDVSGIATFANALNATGAVTANSTLEVNGAATFNGLSLFENTVNYNGTVLFNANVFMDTGDGQIFFNNTDGVTQAAIVFQSVGVTDHQIRITAAGNLDFTTPTAKEVHISGSRVLTVADTGTGNALDADLLDGVEGASYARLDLAQTFTGLNTFDASAASPVTIRRLGASANTGMALVNDAGTRYFGLGTALELTFGANANMSLNDEVWHAGNDGAGSGLDADLLDGLQSTSYAKVGITNTFTAAQDFSVSGSGSVKTALFGSDGGADGDTALIYLSANNTVNRGTFIGGMNTEGAGSTNQHSLVFGTSLGASAPVERMRITQDGNVGISNTNPIAYLDVGDAASSSSMSASGDGQFRIRGGTQALAFAISSVNLATIYTNSSSGALAFGTNEIERMRISASGSVGIGTSNPLALIHAASASTEGARFQNTAATAATASLFLSFTDSTNTNMFRVGKLSSGTEDMHISNDRAAGGIRFLTGGSIEQMRIDSAGKVGVGATSILGKFHVESGDSSGTIQAKTNVMIENNSDAGITISTPAANQGAICFGDNGAAGAGRVIYDHPSDSMQFYTNGAVRTTITAAGNLSTTGSISDSLGNVRQISKSATTSGAIGAANAGRLIRATGNVTITDDVFAANDTIMIANKSGGSITITQDTNLVMTDTNGNTGNRTLANHGVVTIWFNSTNDCIIFGAGLS